MKKFFVLLCVLFFVLLSSSYLMAGGVDNRSNLSGEYIRTLNRNAATDSLDAIAYNPAGVMAMENGNSINVSNQFVTKDYKNTVNGTVYKQDTPSNIPALFGLLKHEKWAGFFAFTIPAGGGSVDYDNGSATTRIGATGLINALNYAASLAGAPGAVYGPIAYEKLKAKSVYYGFTVGGAYKFNDIFSFSLAGRYIDANKKAHAEFQITPTDIGTALSQPPRTAVLDYKDDAEGYGFIVGFDINYEPFIFSVKYETETDLDFTYDVRADSVTGLPAGLGSQMGITNGLEHARNLPAVLAVGMGYRFSSKLRADVNFTNYFQEDADWGGAENNVSDGREAGIAVEYIVNPKFKLSAGYLHTDTGMTARYALKEAPELNANSFGAGFAYQWKENLKIDFGAGVAKYDSDSYTDTSSGSPLVIGLEKDVVFLSGAIQYRF